MARLTRQQQRDLEILHTLFVAGLADHRVTDEEVDNWCASVKLWYIVAAKLGKHVAAMQAQNTLAERMCLEAEDEILTMTDEELGSIKKAVSIMQTLAKLTTAEFAKLAADHAEVQTNLYLKEIAYRN